MGQIKIIRTLYFLKEPINRIIINSVPLFLEARAEIRQIFSFDFWKN